MAGVSETTRRFAEEVGSGEGMDLARAALLVAVDAYPGLSVDGYMERLEEMGIEARERLPPDASLEASVDGLNAYLFDALGFRGNEEAYTDPRNSYLNEVIDRRLGIPITLGLVYLEVARRVGVPAHGIGLPGHFIVGVGEGPDRMLVDPYHQGRRLTRHDAALLVRGVYGDALPLRDEHLAPATKLQFLYRLLNNLKIAYLGRDEADRALPVIDKMLVVEPRSWADVRDRGLVLNRLGRYAEARGELRRYLTNVPEAPDRFSVEGAVAAIDSILQMYR